MRRFVFATLRLGLLVLLSALVWGCAAGGPGTMDDGGGFGSPDGAGGGGDAEAGRGGPDAGSDAHAREAGHPRHDAGHEAASGEAGDAMPATFTIGGTVTGLTGTGLVLEDNGKDNLSVTKNGAFTFAVRVASGGAYAVTIANQPTSPAQMCTVSGASGTVAKADIKSVVVNCTVDTYTIGGMISGLSGTVVLEDNGGDDLTVTADGAFTFMTPLATGASYVVTVLTQPTAPSQTCLVTSGGSGVVGSSDVTGVVITCTTNAFTVGGMVSGLSGTGLVLQDNGGDDLPIYGNGMFTFATPVLSGSSYTVTVLTEPSLPTQSCSVTTGAGTITSADVTTVTIVCSTSSFTVGGTLTGLAAGTTVVLEDNLADDLPLTANGVFTFATPVASGATYSATVLTQPTTPGQTCTVTMGSGTVLGGPVTSIAVNCVLNAGCGRFASGFTGAWSTVSANPLASQMGLSEYLPANIPTSIYLNRLTVFEEYESATDSYASLLAPTSAMTPYGNTAVTGSSMVTFSSGNVFLYDMTTGSWTTPLTGLTTMADAQVASNGTGNIWGFENAGRLILYRTSTNTVSYYDLTTALVGTGARVTFDSCTGLVYVTSVGSALFYSYDAGTKAQTTLASLPGGLTFEPGFCGDHSGHIYAATNTTTMYEYTTSTNKWAAMPAGGLSGGTASACGVGSDGYLYATDPSVSSSMYRIGLD